MTALVLTACRQGRRVRFFTAAGLVNRLEEAQKQYQLEKFLTQLDKTDLLICDELGYLSFSRTGAELLFQIFADRYERASLLVTSNLAFSDWSQVFQGERMTAALLDCLTLGLPHAPLPYFRDERRNCKHRSNNAAIFEVMSRRKSGVGCGKAPEQLP